MSGVIAARKAEQRRRARPHTRREMKLPEGAVVFAYFGDLVYVDHSCWHAWMEIVRLVPGSVLWLALGNASADTTVNYTTVCPVIPIIDRKPKSFRTLILRFRGITKYGMGNGSEKFLNTYLFL